MFLQQLFINRKIKWSIKSQVIKMMIKIAKMINAIRMKGRKYDIYYRLFCWLGCFFACDS
jgi:hypothetical protein